MGEIELSRGRRNGYFGCIITALDKYVWNVV